MREQQGIDTRLMVVIALAVAAIVVVLLGTVGVTATALPGCESCHYRDQALRVASENAAHPQVPCADCHVQKDSVVGRTKFATYEVFGMWLPVLDPGSSDATVVRDESCLSCHSAIQDRVTESRGLRVDHFSCAAGRSCTDCHSEVGHGEATTWPRSSSMNDCVSCHKLTRNSTECKTCHTGQIETATSSKAEFRITHGPNWQKAHGLGDMSSCATCHNEDKCSKCHGPGVPHNRTFLQDHPQHATSSGAKCKSCHQPAFCNDCHGTEMPHPERFASQHSRIVKEKGDAPCLRCHSEGDCDSCHDSHVHPGGAVGNIPSPERGDR